LWSFLALIHKCQDSVSIWPQPLSSKSFPIHHPSVNLSFSTTYYRYWRCRKLSHNCGLLAPRDLATIFCHFQITFSPAHLQATLRMTHVKPLQKHVRCESRADYHLFYGFSLCLQAKVEDSPSEQAMHDFYPILIYVRSRYNDLATGWTTEEL
jgi:hypothetical protein